ncbi:MAG: 50S ribosomal protein L13e [Thermoprotei archaeon]|nr:MAG: 50S ribosomal protein L13e [Thermoprotei archaeon]RLE89753.1 MAG: 50S ribosomal protein L13e [Thermoprotei archaeon]
MKEVKPPKPIIKTPILKKHGGVPPRPTRAGRGFSVGEIKAVGLDVTTARKLGLYVDTRRKSVHEDNIKALSEWLEKVRKGEVRPSTPTLPKVERVKGSRGRVFRGLTKSGRKARGLLSVGLRETHKYKWKKKRKERKLKKRHEAIRHKGGH